MHDLPLHVGLVVPDAVTWMQLTSRCQWCCLWVRSNVSRVLLPAPAVEHCDSVCQTRVARQCRHADACGQSAIEQPQLDTDAGRLHPCLSDLFYGLGQRVLGRPHHWGGASPRCLSCRCSRLVQSATKRPHLLAEALWPPPELGHVHPHTSQRAQSCRPPVGPAAARCSSKHTSIRKRCATVQA